MKSIRILSTHVSFFLSFSLIFHSHSLILSLVRYLHLINGRQTTVVTHVFSRNPRTQITQTSVKWYILKKWSLNRLFLFISSSSSSNSKFSLYNTPIHTVLVHNHANHSLSLVFLSHHPSTYLIYLHLSTHRCSCVYVLRKKVRMLFFFFHIYIYIYIHVSRVCLRLIQHSVRLNWQYVTVCVLLFPFIFFFCVCVSF